MTDADFDVADAERLTVWLDKNLPELGSGPLKTRVITGGSTNLILSLDRGGKPAVLRSPPRVAATPQGAKTIAREATILGALTGSDVPHPPFHAFCEDTDILGVPFYVMDNVDGWAAVIDTSNNVSYDPPFDTGADNHYIAYAAIEGLASMANLDYKAVGLEGFGKTEGFLERQPDRWVGALASYPKTYPKYTPRQLDGLDVVVDYLRANVPTNSTPGLMHGDYSVSNVLFARRPPARLIAILDWETATIGDPLLDLAQFAQSLRTEPGKASDGFFDSDNWPLRADGIAYYADLTGRDVSQLDYYLVLNKFRSACMMEYKVAEAVQGLSSPEKGDRFAKLVSKMIGDAADIARSAG